MATTKRATPQKKEKELQWYGFVLTLVSCAMFAVLLILPLTKVDASCDELLELKIGSGSYPFPIIVFVAGVIMLLGLADAIADRIRGPKK